MAGRVQRVEGAKQSLEAELGEAAREAQEAQAAAAKLEADLKALSSAYTDLESHAHRLEAQQPEGSSPQPGEREIFQPHFVLFDTRGRLEFRSCLHFTALKTQLLSLIFSLILCTTKMGSKERKSGFK